MTIQNFQCLRQFKLKSNFTPTFTFKRYSTIVTFNLEANVSPLSLIGHGRFLLTLQCQGKLWIGSEMQHCSILENQTCGSSAWSWWALESFSSYFAEKGTPKIKGLLSPLLCFGCWQLGQELHETKMDKYFQALRRNLGHPPIPASPIFLPSRSKTWENLYYSTFSSSGFHLLKAAPLWTVLCEFFSHLLISCISLPLCKTPHLQKRNFWTPPRASDAFFRYLWKSAHYINTGDMPKN